MPTEKSKIQISSQFDAGNIEVIEADDASDIRLKIKRDAGDEHAQWFYFQLSNAAGGCTMTIANAGEMSYPDGFRDYQAVASIDGEQWFRVPTAFDGNELVISHEPPTDQVFYAYFAPYSYERHQWLISDAAESDRVRTEVLCQTPDGRALTLLKIGDETPGTSGSGSPRASIRARAWPSGGSRASSKDCSTRGRCFARAARSCRDLPGAEHEPGRQRRAATCGSMPTA